MTISIVKHLLTTLSAPMALVIVISVCSVDVASAIERRRDQFLDTQGYYVFIAPYSLPGIGSGVGLVGAVSNIANSYTDFYAYALGGDIEGGGFALSDVHLISKRLVFDLIGSNFSKLFLQNYNTRGIGGDKDDYTLLELDNNEFLGARLTGIFYDRMLEFYTMGYDGNWHISALHDSEGDLIQTLDDSDDIDYGAFILGARVDYTDDYQNPRVGIRLDVNANKARDREDHSPDQYRLQYNLTGYIPFRRWDTLVLNYFQADAVVQSEGETDPAQVAQIFAFDCTQGTTAQQADCNNLVDTIVSANRYGTAGGLGGTSRLRAYPQNRFNGAHVRFAAVEYRWNITDESTPFNILIAKDIRTSIQMAVFYEIGAVADRSSQLYDKTRSNVGVGARMVTEGGFVIRADIATGNEGPGVSIIIGYPWESF
ncbi:MAG: hypothetical protein BMS9Abin36_0739 [Gammaproteobacteria bacterium]|nr:MAG: hypothetical protein BMS9Abin36_0739 [Gammaproteobacteria bacterium]